MPTIRTPARVRTYGLTHVALAVRDPQRSLAFYQRVLGVVPVYQDQTFVQVQTPGSRDVIVFERQPRRAGRAGGVAHFGFRLMRAADIERARRAIRAAGGTIRETGEFVPGELRSRDLVRVANAGRSARWCPASGTQTPPMMPISGTERRVYRLSAVTFLRF